MPAPQTSLALAGVSGLPPGFRYEDDFLSADEEAKLLAQITSLPFREAAYKQFTARRRIVSFGHQYDFSAMELKPAGAAPDFLLALRERVSGWSGVAAGLYVHTLVAEYRPGTPLGWHRDVPDFEKIAGISLAAPARLRLRPWPHRKGRRGHALAVTLEARSIYGIEGEARWKWQHAVSATKALRYSITFRSMRAPGASRPSGQEASERSS